MINDPSKKGKDNALSLSKVKDDGNDFVRKHKFIAGIDIYLKGLQKSSESDFVATLLSNRCQAHIHKYEWHYALCDAAASLTIRPNNEKTWARYQKCHDHLLTDRGTTKQAFLSGALCDLPMLTPTLKKVDMVAAEKYKKDGNDLYKKQEYAEAIDYYSKALEACGETTRAVLANWALCALRTRNFGDTIAATVASLRIGFGDKAMYRLLQSLSFLGEYDLVSKCFDEFEATFDTTASKKDFSDLREQVSQCINLRPAMLKGDTSNPQEVLTLIKNTPPCIGNWVHPFVETFNTPDGKGRGLRALKDMPLGAVVLLEWPLVDHVFDAKQGESLLTTNTEESRFQMASSAQLRPIVVNRLRRESVLGQVLARMSDGERTPDLCPVSDILLNLGMFPLLLPTHHDYMKDGVGSELTAEQVDKILNINCHGSSYAGGGDQDSSSLYPLVSMMNHKSDPNCSFVANNLKMLSIVVTCKDIKAGDEMFMKYQSDKVVQDKWGIKA